MLDKMQAIADAGAEREQRLMSQLGKLQSQVGAGGGAGRGKGNPTPDPATAPTPGNKLGGGGGVPTGSVTRHTRGPRDQAHHIFAHDIRTKHLSNTHTHTHTPHTHSLTHSHTHTGARVRCGEGARRTNKAIFLHELQFEIVFAAGCDRGHGVVAGVVGTFKRSTSDSE
jgi:hypothetical protein